MRKHIREILGWYGTIAILLAYFLLSFSFLRPTDMIYQVLNITGSVGIIVVALSKKDYQPAVLNIIWAAIAGITILRLLLKF